MRGNMCAERKRLGLTANEVASAVGVHPNALLRWERDEAVPMASNIVKLANFYGVTVEYLIEQTEDPHGVAVATKR